MCGVGLFVCFYNIIKFKLMNHYILLFSLSCMCKHVKYKIINATLWSRILGLIWDDLHHPEEDCGTYSIFREIYPNLSGSKATWFSLLCFEGSSCNICLKYHIKFIWFDKINIWGLTKRASTYETKKKKMWIVWQSVKCRCNKIKLLTLWRVMWKQYVSSHWH